MKKWWFESEVVGENGNEVKGCWEEGRGSVVGALFWDFVEWFCEILMKRGDSTLNVALFVNNVEQVSTKKKKQR